MMVLGLLKLIAALKPGSEEGRTSSKLVVTST
jgi:hypothetical protein